MVDRVILPFCSRMCGRDVTQYVAVMDLKGMSIGDLMSKRMYTLIGIASKYSVEYYPDIIHKTLVINAPALFSGFWRLIKPLLSKNTDKTVEILGDKYLKSLQSLIDADCIPEELGGTCTQPLDNKDHGPYVPDMLRCLAFKKWDLTDEDRLRPLPEEPVRGPGPDGHPSSPVSKGFDYPAPPANKN